MLSWLPEEDCPVSTVEATVGELKGEMRCLTKRIDDLHRLVMVLVGVAGGGLLAAVAGLIVQLVD